MRALKATLIGIFLASAIVVGVMQFLHLDPVVAFFAGVAIGAICVRFAWRVRT